MSHSMGWVPSRPGDSAVIAYVHVSAVGCRICRPGSIIGPQQHYLEEYVRYLYFCNLQHFNSCIIVLVYMCARSSACPGHIFRKQPSLWVEGDSVRAQQMSKLQYKSDKMIKADKIAKAEKLEKQAWMEKIERQEKMRSSRMMDPLEAHMLSKITAGVDTMIMTGKHKEYMLAEEVRMY